jgi:hypothetical protein
LRALILTSVIGWSASAFAQSVVINEAGSAGAPVTAASGVATKIISSVSTSTDWSFMPEGGDVRCELRGSPDAAASPAPSATVGFLFKSNVLIANTTFGLGATTAKLGLDCAGVSGGVPVDTWHE